MNTYNCDETIVGTWSATPVDYYIDINNVSDLNGTITFTYDGLGDSETFEVFVPYYATTTPYSFVGSSGTAVISVTQNIDVVRVRVTSNSNPESSIPLVCHVSLLPLFIHVIIS